MFKTAANIGLLRVNHEIEQEQKRIAMNNVLSASDEKMKELQQTRRYYQVVLVQQEKEENK